MTRLGSLICSCGKRTKRDVGARAIASAITTPVQPNAVPIARRLNRASAILAASVLLDSAVEHYRGGFYNPAMVTPIVSALIALGGSFHAHADQRNRRHAMRHRLFWLTAASGMAGTGFHLYNVLKKPGGLSWQNVFYSGPLGAPAAIFLSGLFGLLAERVRDEQVLRKAKLFGFDAGRILGLATAASMLGTTGEAGLLHFRGSFQNRAMYLPVTIPPIAAALLARAALDGRKRDPWLARLWLRLTAAMGVGGTGFHIYGVSRAMGGWRNWRQNMIDGPPIPAPPSFTGVALAGLAALALLGARSNR